MTVLYIPNFVHIFHIVYLFGKNPRSLSWPHLKQTNNNIGGRTRLRLAGRQLRQAAAVDGPRVTSLYLVSGAHGLACRAACFLPQQQHQQQHLSSSWLESHGLLVAPEAVVGRVGPLPSGSRRHTEKV